VSAGLGTTLGASVLVSCPVLWMVQEGTLTATVAIQRWAICLVLCWLAITAVAFAFPDPRTATRKPVAGEPQEPGRVPADLP
jgi:hypothetical protein